MNHLSLHPTLRPCSSDTILRAIKELTQENISYTSDTGKNYDFNTADTLNTLLLNCMFASDQLKEGEKYDAKPTYKKFSGYRPGVAVIGDLIVGIENSDGNLVEKWKGKAYRLVIQRQKRMDGVQDLWEGEYKYRCILTNDYKSSAKEIVEFYNLRG